MEDAALIATLHTMRTSSAYQKAEALRRQSKASGKSVAAMATGAESSPEMAALMLLIGTWETIALMLSAIKDKNQIFEITPLSQMWDELSPAVRIFRTACCDTGHHFDKLAAEHKAWLKEFKKKEGYETADCQICMHAMFG